MIFIQPKNKGFTLVELSIVLVIIGLLIGGILVAQSMISTTKIQSVVRQLSQYDIARENFRTKYNAVPGPNTLFDRSATAWWGCCGTSNGGIFSNYDDVAWHWPDLSSGTDLKTPLGGNYQPFHYFMASARPSLADYPKFNLDTGSNTNPPILMAGTWGNNRYLYFRPDTSLVWPTIPDGAVKAVDALAIDKKMDDGLADSGNVLGITLGGAVTCDVLGSPAQYNIANTTNTNCAMFFIWAD